MYSELNIPTLKALRLEHVERGGELTWAQICEKYSLPITPNALRKRVAQYEQKFDVYDETSDDSPQLTSIKRQIEALTKLIEELSSSSTDNNSLLYDPYPPELDDTNKWVEIQNELEEQHDYVSCMIWSDIHIPDHSECALQLALKLLKEAQPHVLLMNGDMFDFDILSTFAKSRRRRTQDVFKEIETIWNTLIDNVKKISPDTIIVAYKGNHDDRVERWNNAFNNPYADTIEESFVEIVRSKDRVLWLGQYQETNIGSLFVQHGKRVGENAAKGVLKDNGYTTSVVQGHNHRPGKVIHRVNNPRNIKDYRVVTAVSSGALCNIPPHYQLDTRQTAWLHGIVYAVIHMDSDNVNIQDIVFHKGENNSLWTVFGSRVLSV